MTQPDDQADAPSPDAATPLQQERRDEASARNPDLHGEALEALEGNEDGTGRTLG